jgi:hypothetical protein
MLKEETMSSSETEAEKAGKSKSGAQPLSQEKRLFLEVSNFESMFLNAIANAKSLAENGKGTLETYLKQTLLHDANLRLTTGGNSYQAGLAVCRLPKGRGVIRKFILEQAQSRPLARRGKNPEWRKREPRRGRAN